HPADQPPRAVEERGRADGAGSRSRHAARAGRDAGRAHGPGARRGAHAMRTPRRSRLTLRPLHEVLETVTGRLPFAAGEPAAGARLTVSTLDLDLPLEMRIESGAELRVSLPRGRMATGFDLPLGRITAHFDVVAPENDGGLA